MKKQTIIMDFSEIYREESFFENREEVYHFLESYSS